MFNQRIYNNEPLIWFPWISIFGFPQFPLISLAFQVLYPARLPLRVTQMSCQASHRVTPRVFCKQCHAKSVAPVLPKSVKKINKDLIKILICWKSKYQEKQNDTKTVLQVVDPSSKSAEVLKLARPSFQSYPRPSKKAQGRFLSVWLPRVSCQERHIKRDFQQTSSPEFIKFYQSCAKSVLLRSILQPLAFWNGSRCGKHVSGSWAPYLVDSMGFNLLVHQNVVSSFFISNTPKIVQICPVTWPIGVFGLRCCVATISGFRWGTYSEPRVSASLPRRQQQQQPQQP